MNSDDPKLTAYALDELDPAERAEIEQLLRENPAALTEVEEVTAFTSRLRSELKAEASAHLTDEQRAGLLAVVPGMNGVLLKVGVPAVVRRAWWQMRAPIALAASIAMAAGVVALIGARTYYGSVTSAASRGISDPIAWNERDGFNRLVVRVGDRLTGSKLAERLGADPLLPSETGRSFPLVADAAPVQVPPAPEFSFQLSKIPMATPAPQMAVAAPAVLRPVVTTAQSNGAPVADRQSRYVAEAMNSSIAGSHGNLAASGESRGTLSSEQAAQIAKMTSDSAKGGSASMRAPAKAASGTWQSGAKGNPAAPLSIASLERRIVIRNQGDLSKRDELRQPSDPTQAMHPEGSTEAYDAITDNAFLGVRENPLSTFSIDVDTASYANVRRFLNQQTRPPKGAVRIEELLNYFTYDYPQPEGDAPFSSTMEVATCPWAPEHRLVRIGLKGREIAKDKRPASNLVFLIDVSGSMQPENKLPLLKRCLAMLVDQLTPEDTVSIAVYAGASGVVLEPTHNRAEIRAALDRLASGGSTNGGAGIQLAYRLAEQSFIKGGVNRVILATDGDFNVGVTSQSELTSLIERQAKKGTFLTVLGFGMGNLKDSTLEKLADKGNGNYAYIDTLNEGRKVLVEQINGTLVTIAKDVKIQVEFNPAQVGAYRLIGYENRLLAKEDFNDDKKDAGEIGAGHTVTALYEVVPAGVKAPTTPAVDELKYGSRPLPTTAAPDLGGSPGDAFVAAYKEVQRAEQAEQRGQIDAALNGYRQAGAKLGQVAQSFPDWQPSIVAYRQQRTNNAISRLEKQSQPSGSVAPEAAPRTADSNPAKAEAELLALKSNAASKPQPANLNPQSAEMLTLKLRYKQPDGDTSKLLAFPLTDGGATWEKSSRDFRFAAAVAGFGMLLRESPHKGSATWESIRELAVEGRGEDRGGYRGEFLTLLDTAKALTR